MRSLIPRSLRFDTDDQPSSTQSRCDHCGLPAVCFGADLIEPKYRCPRCCRRYRQSGGAHGPEDYLAGHIAAEGCAPDRLSQEADDARN